MFSIHKLECETDLDDILSDQKWLDNFYLDKEFIPYDYSKKMSQKRKERIMSDVSADDNVDSNNRTSSIDSYNSRSSGKASIDRKDSHQYPEPNIDSYDLLGLDDEFEDTKDDMLQKDSFDNNKTFVYTAIEGIFSGKDLNKDDQLRVFELLHEDYIVKVVANYLSTIKSSRELPNSSLLRSLGEIIKYLLTVSIHDKQNDYSIISAVLGSSQFIFSFDPLTMKKILLTHWIKDHGVWQDISKWILWIYKDIEDKRQGQAERKNSAGKISDDSHDHNGKRKSSGWIKGFRKMITGRKDSSMETENNNITESTAFNVMSLFVYHFANFGVTREWGKKLIMYFSEKYSLDETRTHTLITEFESHQRRGEHVLNDREKLMVPLLKRSKRLK